jgi:hypothetical protein
MKSKNEFMAISSTENQQRIENHKMAATHFEAASRKHLEAAKYHEDGDYKKAARSTITAQGHATIANDAQRGNVRHHVIQGKSDYTA